MALLGVNDTKCFNEVQHLSPCVWQIGTTGKLEQMMWALAWREREAGRGGGGERPILKSGLEDIWTPSVFFFFFFFFFFLLHCKPIDLFEVRLFSFINGIDDTYGERFLTMTVSFLPCLSFGGLPSCFFHAPALIFQNTNWTRNMKKRTSCPKNEKLGYMCGSGVHVYLRAWFFCTTS